MSKRNNLAELIFLFKTGLARLMSKLSLISRTNLLFPCAKTKNSSKEGTLLQIERWSRIALSFDGFIFFDVKGEQEKDGKLSFLDVEVSRQEGHFVTTVYRKPTFSGVYMHFESFLPTIYKFGMIYTLVYRCFKICSDWTKFHEELNFLKQIFLKNGYPPSFTDNYFKTFDQLFIKSHERSTVEKKTLILSLTYLGNISLQTRTKLKKSFKGIINCCKLQIVFKSHRKLASVFRFKDRLSDDLVSGVVYKYICGSCNLQ